MRLISTRVAFVAAMGALAMTGGCTPLRGHQGYVIDPDLVNSVQPGVDNRQTVAKVLGKPTFTSQFNEGEWFYVSRDTRYFAYNLPKPKVQTVLRIRFDDKGVVSNVDRTGVDQVASITPYSKITPTLGRKHSFFRDVFGNIGAVGAGANPQGPGGGGGGGGRP
ncbi:MAG: outer membrane protein assembly factor BamE [Sphingomonas sp.]|uniref:outer membrane protein assembly factor BamE n=1 Tax=Sphingomonas sp. TaxID=28214 RepID=UPI0025E9D1E1|nr:outer membrane protein assembly factor BamE [Sphingomonas sp.]MBY0283179.1 outer membrane protein assembly factor BamE [Sphingomonas sp.]